MQGIHEILCDEAEVERKLKLVKKRYAEDFKPKLRLHKEPEDFSLILSAQRDKAYERNAQLVEDLDITAAKLHTKRLCPMEKKLKEMKVKLGAPGKSLEKTVNNYKNET